MALYQAGDYIIYGSEGVCKVEAVGHPDVSMADANRMYYTLSPVYRGGCNYVPVDSKVFMRPVISRKEALALVEQATAIEMNHYENCNLREINDHYTAMLQSHDCKALVQLVKTVYQKRGMLLESGKKLGQIDERYMKRAEELLYGELAVALEMERDAVSALMLERLD
jgi:Transcriptional regulators, similar to M. xanthus CarD